MRENVQLDHHEVSLIKRKYPLTVIAADIVIASNVGSLFRICDALGVEKLILTGNSALPTSKKVLKSARSTLKSVDYEYQSSTKEVVAKLKQNNYEIISLEITANSVDLSEYSLSDNSKICLILGSEKNGVEDEILTISDHTIHIPMHGQNSSMNVSSAAAISIFYLCGLLST